MKGLAIIGGTGLTNIEGLTITRREMVKTPYGAPSGPLIHGKLFDQDVLFLARHGYRHTIPPHRVNYRANMWALREVGASKVIAVAAVGSIDPALAITQLVIPDQIVDYTYSRDHTYFDGSPMQVQHIDFTYPYTETLRQCLIEGAKKANVAVEDSGVYAATQGPRLETAAEIRRLANDGCTIVGMTGMPEASLARELGLDYACCALVVNPAAGLDDGKPIDMDELNRTVELGAANARSVIKEILSSSDTSQ